MGEAALTSHAGGAGHKAAVRKLMEGSIASHLQTARGVGKACAELSAVVVCMLR